MVDRGPKKRKRHWFFWDYIALPLFIFGFLGSLFLGLDQLCVNDANRRLPRYPGAQRLETQFNGLRLRGIGNSLEVVMTPDSLDKVEDWYKDHALSLLKVAQVRGVNTLTHWFEPGDEGAGTNIFYVSQCVLE